MAWMIGRTAAMADPESARRKALAKLAGLAEIEDAESLVVPILIDAILMAESYRGARHQITFLPELTESVDALIRELNIVEKTEAWAKALCRAASGSAIAAVRPIIHAISLTPWVFAKDSRSGSGVKFGRARQAVGLPLCLAEPSR